VSSAALDEDGNPVTSAPTERCRHSMSDGADHSHACMRSAGHRPFAHRCGLCGVEWQEALA